MKTVVTAGAQAADIDVFACAIAYAELLRIEGEEAIPVVAGKFTSSITPSILSWGAEYVTSYDPSGDEKFVIVDMSDPEHLPQFVAKDKVSEVFDHRAGYEEHWVHLGPRSHVELVGSCGTLIWEEFKKRGKAHSISKTSAKLLVASIVSNNLAFRSPLTTERDRTAYADLKEITGLDEKWIAEYYQEQEKILLEDFAQYLRADTKVFSTDAGEFVIGQVEMWDAGALLSGRSGEIDAVMSEFEPRPWIVNILNISKGHNFVYSKSSEGKEIVHHKVGLVFENNVATTTDLLMRKYLMKVLRDR